MTASPDTPIFEIIISGHGPNGNIFVILANATSLLKRLSMRKEADKLVKDVTSSKSYDEAVSHIEYWFAVEKD